MVAHVQIWLPCLNKEYVFSSPSITVEIWDSLE